MQRRLQRVQKVGDPILLNPARMGATMRPRQAGVPPIPPYPFPVFPSHFTAPRGQAPVPVQYPYPYVYGGEPRGPTPIQPDYRTQFESIRNSVSRVHIDAEWLLSDSRSGINSSDREQAAVLSRNARFVETQIKLMSELEGFYEEDNGEKVAEILDSVRVCQRAHMRYIQEEYSSLQVGGRYGPQAKSMFKDIRRSTSIYNTAFID